jgi:hypothetical protein
LALAPAVIVPTYLELLGCIFKAIQKCVRSRQWACEVDVHGRLLQASQVIEKNACAFISTNCEKEMTKNIYFCQRSQPDVQRLQL